MTVGSIRGGSFSDDDPTGGFLSGASVAGTTIGAVGDRPQCLPPHAPRALARRLLPVGACDAHCHLFGALAQHPLDPARGYTPAIATLADYRRVMAAYGIDRAVVVQPSVYGFDNSALLAALADAPDVLRGVGVFAPDTPQALLDAADRAGVRAVRINPRNPAGLGLADAAALAVRIAPLGWHLQLQIAVADGPDLGRLAASLRVPLVIDHLGLPDLAAGPDAPAFRALVALAAAGRVWVKLSAVARITGTAERYTLLAPFVARLVAEAPGALLWGSDWPHTECYDSVPEDGPIVALTAEWLPTPALRQQVLCDNPGRLFWADTPAPSDPAPSFQEHPA